MSWDKLESYNVIYIIAGKQIPVLCQFEMETMCECLDDQ